MVEDAADAIGILKLIQKICYKYEAQQFPPLAAVCATIALYNAKQGNLTTDIELHDQFENLVTAAKGCCGSVLYLPRIAKYTLERDHGGIGLSRLMADDQKDVKEKVSDMAKVTLYIENFNHGIYTVIKQKLENDFLVGQNNYPTTLAEAHNILINFQQDPMNNKRHGAGRIACAQNSGELSPRSRGNIICYGCGQKGHYQWENKCVKADVKEHQDKQQARSNKPAEMISNAKATTLAECMKGVQKSYTKRGFNITTVFMDKQFEPIQHKKEGLGITPNFVTNDEHAPEIERYIRKIKERVRGV
eukprot:jgi/Psemu1/282088/fgenesh1_pg.2_\